MTEDERKPATIAAQAAGAVDTATGGVVPGISMATTYGRGPDYALLRAGNTYGRDDNDTVRQAEEVIRHLEGAGASLLFPSGMAAVAAVFRALPSGARVVLQSGIYHGTASFVRAYCVRRAILLDEVDAALDEANSERLAQILDDLAHKTQFILITHNRASMHKANVLYGTTMDENGISKLLSIKLEDAATS